MCTLVSISFENSINSFEKQTLYNQRFYYRGQVGTELRNKCKNIRDAFAKETRACEGGNAEKLQKKERTIYIL